MRKSRFAAIVLWPILCPTTGLAAPAPDATAAGGGTDVAALRREIAELRASQERRIEEIRRETDQRIDAIESALGRLATGNAGSHVTARVESAPPPTASPAWIPRLNVAGDLRLRFESNFGHDGETDRDRALLRARLRASYPLSDWLTVGGQLATGDPDDPNSTDVTLSNFVDDLQVSLDQAYLRASFGSLQVDAGKFPMPFLKTEMVWDGDVNPQGISATYRVPLGSGIALRMAALYSPIDEQVSGPDSSLRALQWVLDVRRGEDWRYEIATGYYDYALSSLAGADSGDIRSNALAPGGRSYRSDFRLLDGIAAIEYSGSTGRWPLRIVGDYVRNIGTRGSADTGYAIDLLLGRMNQPRDLRLGAGFAVAQTDAVFAAFSQDNTTLATNYRQFSLSADYVLHRNALLNASWYRYRPERSADAAASPDRDWRNRIRLNVLVTF